MRKFVVWPIGLVVLAYAAAMAGIVALACQTRQTVLAKLDHPAAQARWQEWKQDEEARAAATDSSARRRPPKSSEPPAVILLRDHFAAILAAALVTGSALFAVLFFLLRGALVSRPQPIPLPDDEKVCTAALSDNKMA